MGIKGKVAIWAMVLIAVLGMTFLLTSQDGYEPNRYLSWEYNYVQVLEMADGSTYNMDADNVFFNLFHKSPSDTGYTWLAKTGFNPDLVIDLLTDHPDLYDGEIHSFLLTAEDIYLNKESANSVPVNSVLNAEEIQMGVPFNLQLIK